MLLTSHTLPVARSLGFSTEGEEDTPPFLLFFFFPNEYVGGKLFCSCVCSSWQSDVAMWRVWSIYVVTLPRLPSTFFFFSISLTCVRLAKEKNINKWSSSSPLRAHFWTKAVGCNFPPIFGMTLSGPVGIEAPVSHHAAGGMINNKHWWILHRPCGFRHYQAAPKYHLQL